MQEVRIDCPTLARSMLSDLRSINSYGKPGNIPRVPPNIRNIYSSAYDPKVISIGPYHHGKPDLQSMEDNKKRYLQEFLTGMLVNSHITTRELEEEKKLDSLINPVRDSKDDLLSLYSQPPHIESDDFIKMIVLDGCFILSLLIKFRMKEASKDDPIFSVSNLLPLLRGDLLLLENQLPFFILEKLYELIPKPNSIQPFPTLKEIAFAYITLKLPGHGALNNHKPYHLLHLYHLIFQPKAREQSIPQSNQNAPSTVPRATKLHLLHLYHLLFQPKAREQSIPQSNQNAPSTVPSATKLREAGIKLSAVENAENFLEVSYINGELQIPRLEIKDVTIPIFRNLIAFEQCCPNDSNHFTAYTRFMDLMVNNTEDVEVLQESKIIENKLGSEKEVVKFLNQIFTEVIIDHQKHYLTPVFRGINAYCETKWHRHQAKFRQDYCSSPWAGISVFAATVLLLLTLLQTIYTGMSYYNR